MVLNGAANRDPRRFDAPDEFQLDRANARQHIAFGHGVHTCPGAPLARAEGRVSIERLLDRMRDITISEAEHGPRRRAPLRVRADVHPPRPQPPPPGVHARVAPREHSGVSHADEPSAAEEAVDVGAEVGVSNDSVSAAIAKSMVASTARSTCRFSTRLVASTA